MPDVFTKRKRSEVMSRIRGRGNKDTELALAKLLRKHGITGWRRNQAVFGKPDFVFPRQRLAVFVDGCFWHGCPIHSKPARWLSKSSMTTEPTSCSSRLRGEPPPPRTGRAFWKAKLTANIARDRFVNRQLRQLGWTVLRIWEHDLTKPTRRRDAISGERPIEQSPDRCLRRIRTALIPWSVRYQ